MASDWIKMRTDLYRDPKVCQIADCLLDGDGDLARYVNQNCQCDMAVTRNVMRNVTVGALVSVWGVCRHRGKRVNDDLVVHNSSLAVLDDIADLPGFGAAMNESGWVEITDDGLVFPRFFKEWNVDPEEETKLKNAERQRRFRDKSRNVTVTLPRNEKVTVEKRREEKSNNTPLPPLPFDSQLFSEAWSCWVLHRREIGKRMTPLSARQLLGKLKELGEARAIAAINHSIASGYRGIFEEGQKNGRESLDSVFEQARKR